MRRPKEGAVVGMGSRGSNPAFGGTRNPQERTVSAEAAGQTVP